METSPELSVIVTVVDGGDVLERCLKALLDQRDAPAMEVIVPYDSTLSDIATFANRFPSVQFLNLGSLVSPDVRMNGFHTHVLYDQRRSGGLCFARGNLIAMVEDRGWPRSTWAFHMVSMHKTYSDGVIGGAVECAPVGLLRKAIYYCDFGRYEPPVSRTRQEYLTDINICYKRAALEDVRPLWQNRYQEARVNWALVQQGHRLRLSDLPRVVQQREPIELWQALVERVHWGRTFGLVRGQAISNWKRFMLLILKPLVPLLLATRLVRSRIRSRQSLISFVLVLPVILLLTIVWSLGEAIGELEAAFTHES